MKITGITLWHRRLLLSKPYWLSGGRLKFEALDSTFVRVETDGGLVGWGRAVPGARPICRPLVAVSARPWSCWRQC